MKQRITRTTKARRRRVTGWGVVGGGVKGGGVDLNVRGRGRRRGGGKNSFLCWFRSFIRLNGTKNKHKPFFVSSQHFCKKMSRASFFSGLSKKDR